MYSKSHSYKPRARSWGVLILCLLPGLLFAQLNPFAPSSAGAPLTSASPSGGLNAATYTGAARQAASSASNPFGAPAPAPVIAPVPAQPAVPYGAAAMAGEFGGYPGGMYQMPMVTPTPALPLVKILTGERVYSHLKFGTAPSELLQDAENKTVPSVISELKQKYYNDGTHGDMKANDEVWSFVNTRNDVMSPEEFQIMTRIIASLVAGEHTAPNNFYQIPVSTTDPLSGLPQLQDWEGKRDEKLGEWNSRVLAEFRQNKQDITSQFWPIFIPPPPSVPDIALPPGFNPAAQAPAQGAGGVPMAASGPMGPAGGVYGAEGGEAGIPPGGRSTYMNANPAGK